MEIITLIVLGGGVGLAILIYLWFDSFRHSEERFEERQAKKIRKEDEVNMKRTQKHDVNN